MNTCPTCLQRVRFDRNRFIEAWTSSANRSEVAARTGLSIEEVASRACVLRVQGVVLKQFKRGRPALAPQPTGETK